MTRRSSLPVVRSTRRQANRLFVDLSQSANLYLTAAQARAYEAVVRHPPYRDQVWVPNCLASATVSGLLAALLSVRSARVLLDYGPADPADAARRAALLAHGGKLHTYGIVDINSTLRNRVAKQLEASLHERVVTVNADYTRTTRAGLFRSAQPRSAIHYLGGAFVNTPWPEADRMLKQLVGPRDWVALYAPLPSQRRVHALEPYRGNVIARFVFGPLALAGADPRDFIYSPRFAASAVVCEFVARRSVELRLHSRHLRLAAGDRVRTAMSARRSAEFLLRALRARFAVVVQCYAANASVGFVAGPGGMSSCA